MIAALAPYRKRIKFVGIEAGPLSEWLFGILTECHFNAVCIEARHAHRFLSSRPNKTDRNDARGIADMMRLGHFKAVHVKSRASQLLRTMLAARKTSSTICWRSSRRSALPQGLRSQARSGAPV
jgi:transposase